jgi:hypothetical protein
MSVDYSGLTRNTWPGTWSPNSTHPIVLDTEIRGTLQSISGSSGDRLTDISGARITEGMLVYIKTGYTAGGYTRTSGNYYKYTLGVGQVRDPNTGAMPNAETNWEVFTVSSGGNVANSYLTSTYVANTTFQAALANTNAFIATKVNTTTFNSALANTNAFIKAQLANTNVFIGTKVSTSTFNSALANTNSYIAANSLLERQHLANTNAFIKQQLANTNAYIQSISAGGGSTVSNAPLANGTSLILSNINSQVILKKLKAGRNIEIVEVSGDLILTAIEQRDYGYLTGDYGSLSDPAEVDPLFDYGALL